MQRDGERPSPSPSPLGGAAAAEAPERIAEEEGVRSFGWDREAEASFSVGVIKDPTR